MTLQRFFLFLLVFNSFLGVGLSSQQIEVTAQTRDEIFIPLDRLQFNPSRSQFNQIGVTDLELKVVDYPIIPEGSRCRFTFNQILAPTSPNTPSQTLQSNIETNYLNKSCQASLKKEQQVSQNIQVSVIITDSENQRYGAYLTFFASEDVQAVNPNEFVLPRSFYLEPQVNLILEREDLEVGQTIKAQIEITNRDDFLIKDLLIESSVIDRVGQLACESFEFTDQKLGGRTVQNPFKPIQTVAQNNNPGDAKCVKDQYNVEVNLIRLEAKKTTRLNFDVNIQKSGSLQFDITTNLRQEKFTKQTTPILVITPQTESNNNIVWIYTGLGVVALGGISGVSYRIWKIRKKRLNLGKNLLDNPNNP